MNTSAAAHPTTAAPAKPAPEPTPDTAPYWDGAVAGELRLPRCRSCSQTHFYPRSLCPHCGSGDLEWIRASGRASLYSYVIVQRGAPGFETPYPIAVVTLEEGPRMMANIVDVVPEPERLPLDMALEVVFEPRGDQMLPQFRPAASR